MPQVIQLKISLSDSDPLIWRTLLVAKDTTFFDLHNIIQAAMGWENAHLFEFKFKNQRIGEVGEEDEEEEEREILDATSIELGDVIKDQKCNFTYLYDFGDSWEHQIKVMKFPDFDHALKYPLCIAGKMSAPPEDCGGIVSFYASLEILNNPNHPAHADLLEWYGEEYNYEAFDLEETNKRLRMV